MSPDVILLLAAVAVLALLGGRWAFSAVPLPAFVRPLVETGSVFIFLGAALGPAGANLFTAGLLAQLSPVIVIGLGWIGFLYGSHFELRLLRRYPAALYGAAVGEALLTLAAVAGLSWLLLTYALAADVPARERLAAALILGVCAMGTAPAGVFQLASRREVSPQDVNTLRYLSAVDDLPALLVLGVMGAYLRPEVPGAVHLRPELWLLFSLGIGVGLGWITHWLFPRVDDVRHNSLVLLGIVSLGAGTAVLLRLSPLFVTALAGLTFANLSPRKERAYGVLAEAEHTLYTVFLLVAGLLFRFAWAPLLLLVPAYLVFRALGKLSGGYVARTLFVPEASPYLGAGLLFQGGMALAMAVSFQRAHLAELDSQVTTTIVIGVVVFELAAPVLALRLLGRRGRA